MSTVRLRDVPFLAAFGYAVLHRPGRGKPWVELGRAATMLKALDLVEGKGMFWLKVLTAESAACNPDSETSGDDELEQDGRNDACGKGNSEARRDEVNHAGIHPVAKKLMPGNAGRDKACAPTLAGTT